jgi:flotillin
MNQSKVEVAQARMTGEIGECEKRGQTKQRISQIEAETAIKETCRKKEKAGAEAELKQRQIELDKDIQITTIEAKRAGESRDAELSRDVEIKRAETEYARMQATDLTKMRITKEKMQQQADAELYTAQKKADAQFYAQEREAEAFRMRKNIESETQLYAKQKEAEGINAVYQAQQQGFTKLKEAFGSDDGLMKFLMLEKGLFTELAQANAHAIKGLNPKINIWNTGTVNFIDSRLTCKVLKGVVRMLARIPGRRFETCLRPFLPFSPLSKTRLA